MNTPLLLLRIVFANRQMAKMLLFWLKSYRNKISLTLMVHQGLSITDAVEVHVPTLYVNGSYSDYNPYDYALIKVNEDLSDYAIFNLGIMNDNLSTSKPLYLLLDSLKSQ